MRLANCAGDIIVLKCTRRHKCTLYSYHSHTPVGVYCLGVVVASMYACTPGGPGFESRVGQSLVIESFCILSLNNSPGLESTQVSPPCLGEHVKPSDLPPYCHWSCRVVVPPEYESDKNREFTCVCAYTCAL
ncbi:unnamed protein product, partial [Brenthis ino]